MPGMSLFTNGLANTAMMPTTPTVIATSIPAAIHTARIGFLLFVLRTGDTFITDSAMS